MRKVNFLLFVLLLVLQSSCQNSTQIVPPTPTMPSDVYALASLLHDPDFDTRLRAADQLSQLGPAAAPAVPDLIAALNNTREVRGAAAYALSQIGPAAAPATSELVRLLSDEWSGNRIFAVMALGNIGSAASDAAPGLIMILLSDEEYTARLNAAEALGNIENPIAINALITALSDDDVHVRRYAALAIGKFGEDARVAVPVLAELVINDEVNVSAAAAFSLAKITGENFPDSSGTGDGFLVEANGEVPIVVAAREWWENKGQFEDWDR